MGSGAPATSGAVPAPGGGGDAPPPDQAVPLKADYRHGFLGGYLHFETCDDTFTLNLHTEAIMDGTFYNLGQPATIFQGFYSPFTRNFIYGNVLKDWEYQVSTQFFVDRLNILDLFGGYKFNDEVNFRFGHMLSPFLYEFWAFAPTWEPVIINSPLFQLAGRRQTGAMLWGNVLDKSVQYQLGVFNGADGFYFDLDNHVDFIGSVTLTPFKSLGNDSPWANFGIGLSCQTGRQDYALYDPRTVSGGWGNGEQFTNSRFVGSSGIPFLVYNENVLAQGMRTKFSPHIFWYGQFSFQAEYVWWNRTLADAANPQVNEVVHAYQVTVSYLLTGERHTGDGLLGWAVISPNDPFIPTRGLYGIGAWELAAQYSQFFVSDNVVRAGMVNPAINATRLDQIMVGVNWWPNKYVRFSFDYMHDDTNRPVDLGSGNVKSSYNAYWTRMAMFF